jgi:hypothetical protein
MTEPALKGVLPSYSIREVRRENRDWIYESLLQKIGITEPPPFDDIETAMRPLIKQLGIRKHNRHISEREWYVGLFVAFYYLSLYNDLENSATDVPSPDKEDVMSPKEWDLQQGVESAKLQALKEIGDALDKVISSPDVPDAEKAEFIKKTASHTVESSEARQKGVQFEEFIQQKAQALPKKGDIFPPQPKQEKALQPPDLSEIPLYRGRRGRRKQGSPPEVRPLDFLKTHYGQWLSAFGAEENRVYQDQIRAHDPDLIKRIDNQLRTEGKGRKVRDFVKTRSARRDRELENASAEDLRKNHRLAATLYSREKRAADKAKAAHSHSVTRK